jgi:hypothetical protein
MQSMPRTLPRLHRGFSVKSLQGKKGSQESDCVAAPAVSGAASDCGSLRVRQRAKRRGLRDICGGNCPLQALGCLATMQHL